MTGESVADPKVVNLTNPEESVTMHTARGPMQVDMTRFAAAAKRLGFGDIQKGDILSIGSYQNSKDELVPNYGSIRIERGHENHSSPNRNH